LTTEKIDTVLLQDEKFTSWFYPNVAAKIGTSVEEVRSLPVSYLNKMFGDYIRFGKNADYILSALSTIEAATHDAYAPLYDYAMWESYYPEMQTNPSTLKSEVLYAIVDGDIVEEHKLLSHRTSIEYKVSSTYLFSPGVKRRFGGEAYRLSLQVATGLLVREFVSQETYKSFVHVYEQAFECKAHPDDQDFTLIEKPVDPDLEYLNDYKRTHNGQSN